MLNKQQNQQQIEAKIYFDNHFIVHKDYSDQAVITRKTIKPFSHKRIEFFAKAWEYAHPSEGRHIYGVKNGKRYRFTRKQNGGLKKKTTGYDFDELVFKTF
jgi:hypothetical protein